MSVYILRCRDNTYYCGITNNILRRILEHALTPSYYMRQHRVHRLVYVYTYQDRRTAALAERSIKKHGVKRWLTEHFNQYPSADRIVSP